MKKTILLVFMLAASCFATSALLSGMLYKQQITINKSYVYVKDTVNRPVLLKMESLACFGAGHKTTGSDLVIADSNLNVVTSKILYLDTANSVGEIAFPTKYDSSSNQKYWAYWGRPNFVYQGGYTMGDSCTGYYNMSSAPLTARGLYDMSEGQIFLDTVGQGWSDTQLVAGIWHKAILFNGWPNYVRSANWPYYFRADGNYTIRDIFYFDSTATTSVLHHVGGLAGTFLQITNAGAQFYLVAGRGQYATMTLTTKGWYDVSMTMDTLNHKAKCYINGDSVNSFSADAGAVDRFVIGARPAGSSGCVEKISLVSAYQEIQSPAVVKTLASNFKNYANLFTFGSYSSTAPTISAQPQNQSDVCIGASTSFSVTAAGTGTLHYQWHRYHASAWHDTGSDASTYSWTAAAADNGDSVRVTVTDDISNLLSSNALLTMTVAPSALAYSTNPASYPRNTAITTNTLSYSGSTIDSAKVSPALPTGLSIAKSTGAITGMPTVQQSATAYTVTAWNCSGFAQVSLSIAVMIAYPQISYHSSPAICSTGYAYTFALTDSGGAIDSATFATLPASLTGAKATGTISGTAVVAGIHVKAGYKVRACNVSGCDSTYDTITVVQGRPLFSYQRAPIIALPGIAIAKDSAVSTNGTVDSFKITGIAIPTGLSVAKTTGNITGTIAAAQAFKTYTIRAWNIAGTQDVSILIGMPQNAMSLAYRSGAYVNNAYRRGAYR